MIDIPNCQKKPLFCSREALPKGFFRSLMDTARASRNLLRARRKCGQLRPQDLSLRQTLLHVRFGHCTGAEAREVALAQYGEQALGLGFGQAARREQRAQLGLRHPGDRFVQARGQ
jgi:hypothetical protein